MRVKSLIGWVLGGKEKRTLNRVGKRFKTGWGGVISDLACCEMLGDGRQERIWRITLSSKEGGIGSKMQLKADIKPLHLFVNIVNSALQM
jgi:hypothetical protein